MTGMPKVHSTEIVPYAIGFLVRCHGCGGRHWGDTRAEAEALAREHGRRRFEDTVPERRTGVVQQKDSGGQELIEFQSVSAAAAYVEKMAARNTGWRFAILTGWDHPEIVLADLARKALPAGRQQLESGGVVG